MKKTSSFCAFITERLDNNVRQLLQKNCLGVFFANCLSFCICCRFDCYDKKPRTPAFLALFDAFDNSCQPKVGKKL